MSDLVDYAERELRQAGMVDQDSDYGGMLGDAVLDLVKKFAEEGHSGASAMRCLQLFSRLARFKPLTPLTGEADEWNKIDDKTWQNKRAASVFKDETGKAHDLDAKNQRATIIFPYMPV
jgi:hypothetical protein